VQLMPGARSGTTTSQDGRALRKLRWAALLHEVGTLVSHSDYHKHGAYILDNTDAPGFTSGEMHTLGQLVLGHRGKLRKLEGTLDDDVFIAQLLSLRLAVLLCHARRDPQPDALHLLKTGERTFDVACDSDWAAAYPQSAHLLREECLAWQKVGCRLQLSGC